MPIFKHPKHVCMSYWEHFCFSSKLSGFFLYKSYTAMVHAILPDFYVTSSSDTIETLQQMLKEKGCRDVNDDAKKLAKEKQ